MAKLQINDDGTVTVPLKGRDPVTLDEPSLGEMATWTDAVRGLEEGLTTLPVLQQQTATREEVETWNAAVRDRTRALFGGEQPYAALFLEIVNALAMSPDGSPVEPITPDHLYGWAASPSATSQTLEHFRTPLPG